MSTSYTRLAGPLRAHLQARLHPGEHVIWAGRPNWRAKWRTLAGLLLFACGWTAITGLMFAFAVAATFGFAPLRINGSEASHLWGIAFVVFLTPFVAIGLGLLLHLWREVRSGSRRVHAVTDKRVLTVELGFAEPIETRPRSAINFVHSTERDDGSGNITIAVGVERDAEGDSRPETFIWSGIPDVAFVHATLDRRATSAATANGRAPEQKALPVVLAGLPVPLARAAERETRGERIAWIGQPDARRATLWSMLAWVIAMPWLWFSLRLQATGIGILIDALTEGRTKTPVGIAVVVALFGLPFIWVGLQMLAAPLWARRMANGTAYVISDRRLVTVRRRRGAVHVSTVEPSRIESVSRIGKGEPGSIRIVLGKTKDSDGDIVDLEQSLWLVKDAARVEALIEGLRRVAR